MIKLQEYVPIAYIYFGIGGFTFLAALFLAYAFTDVNAKKKKKKITQNDNQVVATN